MKILKIKFGLFSLLAMLTVSVFLTSCEQEDIASTTTDIDKLEAINVTQEMEESADYFKPAKGFEEKTDEEKQVYLDQLTEEQSVEFEENYRIADYLTTVDALDGAKAMLGDGELLSDIDFTTILPATQIQKLNQHQIGDNIKDKHYTYEWRPWCRYSHNNCKGYKRVYAKYCGNNFIGYVTFCHRNC